MWSPRWNDTNRGKPKDSEKNLSQCQLHNRCNKDVPFWLQRIRLTSFINLIQAATELGMVIFLSVFRVGRASVQPRPIYFHTGH
jgi:hypothetical protein